MDMNKVQLNNNIQFSSSNINLRRANLNMPSDSISFKSKTKEKVQSFLGKFKAFFTSKNNNEINYLTINKGVEEHFYQNNGLIISYINLTEEQKNIIDSKIKAFERYKASLSPQELAELEKNKHSMLDFATDDGWPDKDLKGYKNFLNRYENFKNGDYTNLTNEELSQLLYYTDTTDLISDGKIGSFAQGITGDCWFLSMLGNYASTKEGEENIAKRISKPDKNGTYTVTFDDPFNPAQKKEYKVTQEDLKDYDLSDFDSTFSSGDLDVRILEIATENMLKEYLIKNEKYEKIVDNSYIFNEFTEDKKINAGAIIREGYIEKQVLVHKALGYKSNIINYIVKPDEIDEDHTLVQVSSKEFIENSNAKIFEVKMDLIQENGVVQFKPIVTPTEYKSLSDVITKNNFKAEEMTVGTGKKKYSDNEKENRYLQTGHAYNLVNLNNDGSMTVIDPYNSAFPHTISNADFEKMYNYIAYLPTK